MKITSDDLAGLMARAQDGDANAYRAVLNESRNWLARYFARRIAPAQVDDLVQNTLMSVHAKRATYDPARPYLPWLAAIARYRWVDQMRRHYRDAETPLEGDFAVDSHESPVTAQISLDRLLDRLPEGQATAIRLVKIDGLSVAEASARTGQGESLVKVNIHRGLKKLAQWVEDE